MRIHVPSTECDVISFNGQGQLCLLTCAGWRDVSNYTRMSTIQSRRPDKKARHNVTLTWQFQRNLVPPPLLLSDPKILKNFPKNFFHQNEAYQMSSKNEARNKSQDCCVTLLSAHARTSQANILHLDQKAASVRLANGFMVSFCSFFGKIFRGGWVKQRDASQGVSQ